MAQALRSVEDETPQTALVAQVNANPGLVLLDQQRFDQFYEAIKAETDKLIPDLTTERGRKEIASMAFKVAKTKTAIDAAGKLLNEEARAKINIVDAARRDIRDKLDALKDEVRKPLTDWEAREEQRVDACNAAIDRLKAAAVVPLEDTAEAVADRLAKVKAFAPDEGQFQSLLSAATQHQAATVEALTAAHARLVKEEADRVELDRLREEAAARAEQDRQNEEAAKAECQRVDYVARLMKHITDAGNGTIDGATYPFPILLRELEEKVVADNYLGADRGRVEAHRVETLALLNQRFKEQMARSAAEAEAAEARRIADAAAAAKDEARLAAEAQAQAEREAADRVHAEALAAEKRRADEADAARKAEADRIARETAAREAEEKATADAAASRAADIEHRSKIMGTAKVAIMGMGVGEQAAIGIVRAIAAGDVPNVSIRF